MEKYEIMIGGLADITSDSGLSTLVDGIDYPS